MAGLLLKRLTTRDVGYFAVGADFQSLTASQLGDAAAEGGDLDSDLADLFSAYDAAGKVIGFDPLEIPEVAFPDGELNHSLLDPLASDAAAGVPAGDRALASFQAAVGFAQAPAPAPPPPAQPAGGVPGGIATPAQAGLSPSVNCSWDSTIQGWTCSGVAPLQP